jgi:hypothetical protein
MDPKMSLEEPQTKVERSVVEPVYPNQMTDDLSISPALKSPIPYDPESEEHYNAPAETAEDLITEVIHATDDQTLNPWTFRTWFLGTIFDYSDPTKAKPGIIGIALSTFGGLLATIYHFKPQTVPVSTVFLAVISYVLGEGMALIIPRNRIFNPHPVRIDFSHKK